MRNLLAFFVGLLALPVLIVTATSGEEPESDSEVDLCNPAELDAPLSGGLTFSSEMSDNATTIAATGKELGVSAEGQQVAIAASLVDSGLVNPTGAADQVGLFGLDPATEQATVSQLNDPAFSATRFYQKLRQVPGWENLQPGEAAQTVQRSALPDQYNAAMADSRQIYAQILTQDEPVDCSVPGAPSGDYVKVQTASGSTITVDASLAPSLQRLLDDAAADGIIFDGWGLRTHQRQIELRIKHCGGNNNYAIYEKPSGQCRPPTARPGRSNHETGLAVDFTCNGSTVKSRSSTCFRWLAANAGRYGLKNLPSEPWHWSTNGN